jgi:hypothetical protein
MNVQGGRQQMMIGSESNDVVIRSIKAETNANEKYMKSRLTSLKFLYPRDSHRDIRVMPQRWK